MPGAVFLSYASQDADAARKICEALRAAGCEVWIDQSELHGGDAWDAKIRGQIRECALFVPLISAHTNARLEGYFRREWKQAVERTHDMDESLPFLVPIVIDGTTDAGARVPEKFRHYQWTKLPGGEASPAFVARVRKLLEGEASAPGPGTGRRPPPSRGAGKRSRTALGLAALALVVAGGALAIWRPWRGANPSAGPAAPRPAPSAPSLAAVADTGVEGPVRAPVPARPISRDSVAVLAFENASGDKENEYFSDGISEDLIDLLAQAPGLRVAARTSAFSFKGKSTPVADIAKELGVAFVVEGSVQRAEGRVRIRAQLIKAADGFEVWSERFDRELKDIFALQDEIAGEIAKNLRVRMNESSAPPASANPEAFQLFLAGRDRAELAGTADLKAAIELFQRSIALEPNYAPAWAQMARANIQLARWGGIDLQTGYAAARKAVDKAAALEPDSPVVLVALGWVRRTADWDWKGAREAFQRALGLEPNNPETLAAAAILCCNLGLRTEGIQDARRAVELDPLNAATNLNLSLLFQFDGQLKKAEQVMRRALMLAPGGQRYHGSLAIILSELGRPVEARQEASLERDAVSQKAAYGLIAVSHGAKERAMAMARQLMEMGAKESLADTYGYAAEIYSRLSENDRAFEALGRAFEAHDASVAWIKVDDNLNSLHSDPRWAQLLAKTGLADEQLR